VKGNERAIISGAAVLICAVAFYMLVLSPKRAEVSELNAEVTSLESSIAEQEQLVSFGKQARKQFPNDYGRLVVLGKAVPDEADTASLLVQLNSISGQAGVDFRSIVLNQGATGTGATPAPVAPTPAPTAPSGDGSSAAPTSTETTAPAAEPAAPATEAGAANLPIGAVVGTAGLPTMPYDLAFTGGYFGVADYMGRLDDLVQFQDATGKLEVEGRLMTIDGFSLTGGGPGPNPILDADLILTSYVTPSTQGLTVGATPGGPAPAVPEAAPASQTVAP
jgi:hypothetical protein